MKKVLYATTALVAFAGAAAAEVTITGSAEMGIVGGGGGAGPLGDNIANNGETQFFQDVEVKFTLSGESDSGLSFGAVIDLDETNVPFNDDAGTSVFISGNFGTLTMGDTDGALDWALTENVGNPGSIDDAETLHAGYMGAYGDGAYDGQIVRYDYSFGDFGFAVSVEMDDSAPTPADPGWAVGGTYSLALGGTTVNLGAGYQTLTTVGVYLPGNLLDYLDPTVVDNPAVLLTVPAGIDIDIWGVSADAAFGGGFVGGIAYSNWDIGGVLDVDHTAVSAGWSSGPISIGANYGLFDYSVAGLPDAAGWGIAAAYDFGGGLSAHAAYSDSDIDGDTFDRSIFSLGMAMSF